MQGPRSVSGSSVPKQLGPFVAARHAVGVQQIVELRFRFLVSQRRIPGLDDRGLDPVTPASVGAINHGRKPTEFAAFY